MKKAHFCPDGTDVVAGAANFRSGGTAMGY